jgi:predicted acetyltransferase
MTQPQVVHPVDSADVEPWLRGMLRAFLHDPYEQFTERVEQTRLRWQPDRTWAVRDADQWVATLVTEERSLTVPAADAATRDVTVDAVSGVTVSATHRRRGLLSAMLRDSLRAAQERGDALSVLIPAEWPIYGRFGYAPATQVAKYRYHPRRRGATPAAGTAARVRHVEPEELRGVAADIFAAARRRHAGQMDRRFPWWERALGMDGYRFVDATGRNWAVHDSADGPDGLVRWAPTRGFDITGPLGAIRVFDLVAASDEAYRDLWAYLAGIDVIDEIELTERPVDEPVRWLLSDARALEQVAAVDFLWLRLLDVPTALQARQYAVPGQVVLDVVDDDLGGYGAGRVELHADRDQASCTATRRPADLRLTQRALAASYLGGHRLRQRDVLGDVEELTPGAVARFDAMFATAVPPWNQTWF